jgi:hypothetical protein
VINKPIDQINKIDIESLVSAKAGERRTLEYKQQLPEKGSDPSREFLYDVSSFANDLGGDMIFGITDERDTNGKSTGLPGSADGLSLMNVSEAIARLENLVRDGLDPRIQGIQWQQVEGFQKGPILIMRIPKSWTGPHMVTAGGVSRFYSRNSTGKYPLDVGEIRSAFLSQAGMGERIRRFVTDRVSKVIQGESPIPLNEGAKILLHLIPVSSLDPTNARDVTKEAAKLNTELQPMSGTSWGPRFNFDGVLVSGVLKSYVQVFRSGIVEAAEGQVFRHNQSIPSVSFERNVLEATARYLRVQKRLELPLPIFVVITLIAVKGFKMGIDTWTYDIEDQARIDRDILSLPEGLTEDFNASISQTLRPAFDALWQACGFEGSMNYDANGNWKPPR